MLLKTCFCFLIAAASEIQMMALPHAQYVIAEASTPVSGVNSNQVKTVRKQILDTVFNIYVTYDILMPICRLKCPFYCFYSKIVTVYCYCSTIIWC